LAGAVLDEEQQPVPKQPTGQVADAVALAELAGERAEELRVEVVVEAAGGEDAGLRLWLPRPRGPFDAGHGFAGGGLGGSGRFPTARVASGISRLYVSGTNAGSASLAWPATNPSWHPRRRAPTATAYGH
jgi:hypothetical protein